MLSPWRGEGSTTMSVTRNAETGPVATSGEDPDNPVDDQRWTSSPTSDCSETHRGQRL
jgi:hypothetical protein